MSHLALVRALPTKPKTFEVTWLCAWLGSTSCREPPKAAASFRRNHSIASAASPSRSLASSFSRVKPVVDGSAVFAVNRNRFTMSIVLLSIEAG
jgi:hypothetical protein